LGVGSVIVGGVGIGIVEEAKRTFTFHSFGAAILEEVLKTFNSELPTPNSEK
jgi:RsiW-degrading membrane proteinase PrsW (M82 family)